MAFDHKSLNQNSLVQLWEICPKTRDLGLIRPWVSIREGGPDILNTKRWCAMIVYLCAKITCPSAGKKEHAEFSMTIGVAQ